jgi:hypothetical protein
MQAIEAFKEAAVDAGVRAYQPGEAIRGGRKVGPSGDLRYLQMSVERSTQKIQVCDQTPNSIHHTWLLYSSKITFFSASQLSKIYARSQIYNL